MERDGNFRFRRKTPRRVEKTPKKTRRRSPPPLVYDDFAPASTSTSVPTPRRLEPCPTGYDRIGGVCLDAKGNPPPMPSKLTLRAMR